MKSLYEKLNRSYIEVGDVKIPALISIATNYKIGYNLLTSGKLNSYLHDIDIRAKEMYDNLIKQFAEQEGINEQLKTENQKLWVQRMNNMANQAREIVNNEIIYTI